MMERNNHPDRGDGMGQVQVRRRRWPFLVVEGSSGRLEWRKPSAEVED